MRRMSGKAYGFDLLQDVGASQTVRRTAGDFGAEIGQMGGVVGRAFGDEAADMVGLLRKVSWFSLFVVC